VIAAHVRREMRGAQLRIAAIYCSAENLLRQNDRFDSIPSKKFAQSLPHGNLKVP
jgi:hypothetical protein